MHVLDTDTLTYAHAGHPGIAQQIVRIGEEHVATTVINAIEILPTAPGLSIISYHNGTFSQGQTGAAYILQL